MLERIGPQQWWPADSRFEIMVGAVLVQRTRWENTAMSIAALAARGLLDPEALASADVADLQKLIAPSGFMTSKSRACIALARWAVAAGISETTLPGVPDEGLRATLLALPGVGPETADAMMLYAFDRKVFVADAYARRLFEAVGIAAPAGYEPLRAVGAALCVESAFSLEEYKELHALIDEHGKLVRTGAQSYGALVPAIAGMSPGQDGGTPALVLGGGMTSE